MVKLKQTAKIAKSVEGKFSPLFPMPYPKVSYFV